MDLAQQGDGPLRYTGAGSIRYDSTGNLEYVLYDTTAVIPLETLLFGGGSSGEFLRAEDFVVLTATDLSGDEWVARWVEANTYSTASFPGAVVRGKITELVK